MHTVGIFEARTRLPELLRLAEQGESITITRRGMPVARLVGTDDGTGERTGTIIARMKRARARRSSVSVKEVLSARDQGRRP